MANAPLSTARIVDCARRIVRADGVGALGLRRIARDLGVTAPALYGYVDSLEDLFRVLAEAQFAELVERFETVGAGTAEERVRALSRQYVGYALEEPELFGLLFRYPPDLSGSGVEHELPIATKVFMAAAEPLEQGRLTGEFPDIDPLQSALAVWAAVHGCATVLSLGFDFNAGTTDQLVEDVLDMVIAGLRTS